MKRGFPLARSAISDLWIKVTRGLGHATSRDGDAAVVEHNYVEHIVALKRLAGPFAISAILPVTALVASELSTCRFSSPVLPARAGPVRGGTKAEARSERDAGVGRRGRLFAARRRNCVYPG